MGREGLWRRKGRPELKCVLRVVALDGTVFGVGRVTRRRNLFILTSDQATSGDPRHRWPRERRVQLRSIEKRAERGERRGKAKTSLYMSGTVTGALCHKVPLASTTCRGVTFASERISPERRNR